MGNTPSAPGESVMKAVEANKPYELAKLIQALQQSPRGFNPRWLEWRDSCGRTPIIVCARENKTACAEVLLKAGCDVNYINCMQEQRGSALHEAAHKNNDAMVDLLMRYGGNPWIANVYGRTALHEASIVKAPGPIFRFRHAALHTGMALVKQSKLGGLSTPWKPMVLMITPYFYCPRSINNNNINTGRAKPPRKQLWLLSDEKVEEPKANVWLEGATVLETPKETLLRLHPTHSQPKGELHTRYDHGYCISLRPLNNNPETLSAFRNFLAECCVPSRQGQQHVYDPLPEGSQNLEPTPHTSPQPAPHIPRTPSTTEGPRQASEEPGATAMQAQPGETDVEYAARLAALVNDGNQPVSPQSHPTAVNAGGDGDATNPSTPARPEGGSPRRSASGEPPQQPSPNSASMPANSPTPPQLSRYPPIPSLTITTDEAPAQSPPSVPASHPIPPPTQSPPTQSALSPQPSDRAAPPPTGTTHSAQPHSADAQLVQEEQQQQAQPPAGTAHSAQPHSADAQLVQEQQQQQQAQSPVGTAHSAQPHSADTQLVQEHEQQQAQQQQLQQQLQQEQEQQVAQQRQLEQQLGEGAGQRQEGVQQERRGSGNRAVDAIAAQPSDLEDEQLQCIICMEAPRECGFLHGGSMHLCVCRECKKSITPGSPCPLCRMTVERTIDVF